VDDDAVSAGSAAYMKFESGDNQFRAISKPITGWVVWEEGEDEDKKPVRTRLEDGEPDAPSDDPMDKPKKFLAFAVIDRADDEVKILEVTQQSVIKAIKALADNAKWGNPFTYDINVSKKGEGKKTRYTVTPEPKTVLSKELMKAAAAKPCNLEALYEGENPWEIEDDVTEYHFK
jgi:hypothetical protein